ncbi:POC1 centriolar protein A, partial [Ceratobasidium sp. 392]
MSSHRMFSVAGDAAIQLLQLISASAEVFPPLKGAAEGALHIAGIVKRFRSNKDQWQDFGTFVQDATASVLESFARPDSPEDTKFNLVKLQNVLEDSAKRISSEQALPRHRRLAKFLHDPDMIADMKARIEDAIKLFQLNTAIATVIDVRKTFDAVVTNGKTLSEIKQDTSTIIKTTASLSLSANLEKLRRVQGASWDIYRVCLANTRTTIIEDILSWVHNTSETSGAKILLLTAVAGAGKTTIAHTVAQKCADRKLLGSSFFFDRETEGRNSPTALFSTIAADLSRLDKRLAERISQAIEDDKSLPSAPLSRQFEELVLKPSQEVPPIGPLVVVIDALDEAWDKDLLVILRDYAPRLPNTFRIFLTSRMRPELDGLPRKPHVHWIDLDIGSQTNIQDISVFVPYKLQQLAEERDLGEGWPGEQLRTKFHSRAGGLFLWVAIVCDYLRDRDDPTRELDELLSAVDVPMGSAEAQMDRLYATILLGFDWSDASFVTGYRRVIGTAIATKTPLTISEMKELFQDQPLASDYALQRLSPLLTGMSKAVHNTQP